MKPVQSPSMTSLQNTTNGHTSSSPIQSITNLSIPNGTLTSLSPGSVSESSTTMSSPINMTSPSHMFATPSPPKAVPVPLDSDSHSHNGLHMQDTSSLNAVSVGANWWRHDIVTPQRKTFVTKNIKYVCKLFYRDVARVDHYVLMFLIRLWRLHDVIINYKLHGIDFKHVLLFILESEIFYDVISTRILIINDVSKKKMHNCTVIFSFIEQFITS